MGLLIELELLRGWDFENFVKPGRELVSLSWLLENSVERWIVGEIILGSMLVATKKLGRAYWKEVLRGNLTVSDSRKFYMKNGFSGFCCIIKISIKSLLRFL